MIADKVRVAVLRGGPSTGYHQSLKTGAHILSTLAELPDYEPIDIFISKDGEWHRGGLVGEPHRLLRHTDVVWNALHGSYGEDGQVQRILETLQVPFTGPNTIPATLAINKEAAKRLFRDRAILTPAHELLTRERADHDKLIEIFRTYLHPVIVKPANLSGSLGVRLAHSYPELIDAVERTFEYSPRVMVEEFVRGEEASCTVVENAKGEELYAFLPVTHSGRPLHSHIGRDIENLSKMAHQALGLSHYSSSDFVVTPKNKIYILETNALPALHPESVSHRAMESTGWRARDFVDHVIKLVRR